jgi:hypothetical protein
MAFPRPIRLPPFRTAHHQPHRRVTAGVVPRCRLRRNRANGVSLLAEELTKSLRRPQSRLCRASHLNPELEKQHRPVADVRRSEKGIALMPSEYLQFKEALYTAKWCMLRWGENSRGVRRFQKW